MDKTTIYGYFTVKFIAGNANESFAGFLRHAAITMRKTQRQLAEIAEVRPSTMSRWMAGATDPHHLVKKSAVAAIAAAVADYEGRDAPTGYVCVRLERPPRDSNSTDYKASFSFCAPQDSHKFSRPKARKIADSRMTTSRVKSYLDFTYNRNESTKLPDIFKAALNEATVDKEFSLKVPDWFLDGRPKSVSFGVFDTVGKRCN